jgi:hypothetical protein
MGTWKAMNGTAYFARTVSYTCKMFVKLAPRRFSMKMTSTRNTVRQGADAIKTFFLVQNATVFVNRAKT